MLNVDANKSIYKYIYLWILGLKPFLIHKKTKFILIIINMIEYEF